ncbi:MAG: gamma-glutamyltransferase [SAR202 cluster bacterium]|nr:gamma-glutamyltransferase [SAR202 cluster bacterium]
MPIGPHAVSYEAHRPVVMGRKGMVSSGHPLASQAGMVMLQKGGNAIDAAAATAAALNVVEPMMSGIGGDGFIMAYIKDRDELKVVNATGAAPLAATLDRYPKGIPLKGIMSILTPGLLQGWYEAHKRYGKLEWSEVLEPAIDLAENGFPVSHHLSKAIAADTLLCQFPTSRAIFTRDGKPLQPGQVLYQQDLARTLVRIAQDGPAVFYEGDVAQAIVKFCQSQGGLLSLQDLKRHKARWQDAIGTTYRGHTVYEAPPNSSGHVLLQELNLAETFDLKSMGCNTAECIHLMVEAKKLAFADREAYLADPEFVDVPIPGLLSKDYARERARLIDPHRAAVGVKAGDPWRYQGNGARPPKRISKVGVPREDTTCFAVVDQWGNAVSQLQSLQSAFGSSLVAAGTGVLLNNRMSYFHLDPNHVDKLEPGKRVRHTMNPVMVFRQGANGRRELALACGTPGADTQVQTNFQVITHVLDFGMTVQEAVEAPRWRSLQNGTESTFPHTCEDEVWIESRFPKDVVAGLEKKGHALKDIGPWVGTGSEVMIWSDGVEGALHGAADPRRDAYAVGW